MLPGIPEQEAIAESIESTLLDLHTGFPGKVVQYDHAKQRATIQPCVRRAITGDDNTIAYEDYKPIPNVLVGWPGSAKGTLRFELVAGDPVWVLFAEQDSSGWERTGEPQSPVFQARHSLNSPFAIPLRLDPLGATQGNLVLSEPFVIGSLAAAQFVALSNLVSIELGKIAATLGSGTAGGDPVIFSVPYSPGPVAASKLKTE